MPDHVTAAGIDGPDLIWDGEIENAVDEQRRRLDLSSLIGLEDPGWSEPVNVLRVDLSEGAVAAPGVVAVVARPSVRAGMEEVRGLRTLGGE
jgi:hypothetical protein